MGYEPPIAAGAEVETTHWRVRAMAGTQEVSPATARRTWKKHKRQPQRVEAFQFSNDPDFAHNVHDVVGPWVGPPEDSPLCPSIMFTPDRRSAQVLVPRPRDALLPLPYGRGSVTGRYRYRKETEFTVADLVTTGTGQLARLKKPETEKQS